MASRDGQISDDWEDIGDDNLSVVSLPLSEPEVGPAQRSSKLDTSTSTPDGSLLASGTKVETTTRPKSPGCHDPYGIYNAPSPVKKRASQGRGVGLKQKKEEPNDTLGSGEGNKVAEAEEAEPEPLEDPFRDPPSDDAGEGREDEVGETTDSINEIIDDGSRDIDPVYLRRTHQSLDEILKDTLRTVKETPVLGQELTGPSISLCSEIQSQLSKILPILDGYIKASGLGLEIPLDASLQEWLSGVRVKVLGLLAETQRLGREPEPRLRNRRAPWYEDVYGQRSDLERIWDDLSEYKNRMNEFFHILQADFDEFQTQNLTFVKGKFQPGVPERLRRTTASGDFDTIHPNTLETPQYNSLGFTLPTRQARDEKTPSAPIDIPRRSMFYSTRSPPPLLPPNPTANAESTTLTDDDSSDRIWHLRRDIYQLKDALQAGLNRLHSTTSNRSVALPISEWAAVLGARYATLISAIGIVVSNHASEWMDSIATGGLTYQEFMALASQPLSLYTAQLEEIVGDKHAKIRDAFRDELYPARYKPSKRPALDGDELDVLDVVVSKLERSFKIDNGEEAAKK
ncbi:hypothetical protein B0T16DRAFT_124573 [Cercophora newfieldiana]|uniref:Uncharacterized protein n=1 Tax=Cercophora newfieldiana TaxID=92897 RepID=A0AA40CTS4_9PEZI|nr:hypothetical protein B0T16DRAFT_124573 [Cercophora newfieldiana]